MKRFIIITFILAFTQLCGCNSCQLFAQPVEEVSSQTGVNSPEVKFTGTVHQ